LKVPSIKRLSQAAPFPWDNVIPEGLQVFFEHKATANACLKEHVLMMTMSVASSIISGYRHIVLETGLDADFTLPLHMNVIACDHSGTNKSGVIRLVKSAATRAMAANGTPFASIAENFSLHSAKNVANQHSGRYIVLPDEFDCIADILTDPAKGPPLRQFLKMGSDGNLFTDKKHTYSFSFVPSGILAGITQPHFFRKILTSAFQNHDGLVDRQSWYSFIYINFKVYY
jgi:hypothetical protein